MHALIYHNGEVIAAQDVGISPANGGLLHGSGVFTTLRIYNGKPFLFNEHWQRLAQNAKAIGLEDYWPAAEGRAALLALIAANQVKEGKARITLLQAESRYWRLPTSGAPVDLLIFTANLTARAAEAALTISPYRINSNSPLAGIKAIGNLQQILTLKEAEARDFDEAIVLNERGEICETAAANIFWARGGVLYTPTLATGSLPGIARHLTLSLARQIKIETTEGAFQSDHIMGAEEAFLTSSTRELTRASGINFHQFTPRPRSIFERLLIAYQDRVFAETHGYRR